MWAPLLSAISGGWADAVCGLGPCAPSTPGSAGRSPSPAWRRRRRNPWDAARIDAWIANPRALLRGAKMTFVGMAGRQRPPRRDRLPEGDDEPGAEGVRASAAGRWPNPRHGGFWREAAPL